MFDLDAPDWFAELSEDELASAQTRIESSVQEPDKSAFLAFVTAELAARRSGR